MEASSSGVTSGSGPSPDADGRATPVRHGVLPTWLVVLVMIAAAGTMTTVFYIIGHRPRMGYSGLICNLLIHVALVALGVFLVVGVVLVARKELRRPRGFGASAGDRAFSAWRAVGQVLLDIACYGGLGMMTLFSVIALFGSHRITTTAIICVIMAGCIAGIVFFSRWRKRHPAKLGGFWATMGFVALLVGSFASLWFGVGGTWAAVLDMGQGTRTEDLMYISATENIPSGKGSFLEATTYTLYFQTKSTQRGPDDVHVTVTAEEFQSISASLKPGYEATVTLYPHSRVLYGV